LLNNTIYFARTTNEEKPRIKTIIRDISRNNVKLFSIEVYNNGRPVLKDNEHQIFDIKNQKAIGTELIGLAMVKELLKSIQCNLSLIDHGRDSGWVGYQILVKDFE
jgi:nitrogen fixation/metabolism regulation signal transduction histidine kinase